jgi:hypothetical protein
MKDYRTAGINVFIPHYRSDDPRGPQGPALHLYPSDAGPGPLTQDEMDQLPDKVLDQIACIFREANGNDQTTRLCGGCLITLLGNLMVAFAARVVHANGQPDFDGAITALFSLHEHARRIAQQVHAHQRGIPPEIAAILAELGAAGLGGDVQVIGFDDPDDLG